jgi:hypothetical protein
MRRTSAAGGLLNQDRWLKSRYLQFGDRSILHEILPPPDQLRCAELIARRQDDRLPGPLAMTNFPAAISY